VKAPARRRGAGGPAEQTLDGAREAYRRQFWGEAYRLLAAADEASPLEPADVEKLALAAALTGRDAEHLAAEERLFHTLVAAGSDLRAARAGFWLGMRLSSLGETAKGGAWLAEAGRLVGDRDCAERGLLLVAAAYRHLHAGAARDATPVAAEAIAIGERFGEADIVALGRNILGRARMQGGDIAGGLSSLDEAMLAAAPGNVSPIVTGLVYCNVIDCCYSVYALFRAREWTGALAEWCAGQPELVTFAGTCHVHRAELMQITGDWDDALSEARRAGERLASPVEGEAIAPARYQEGEVHRLRGEFAAADAAYRDASRRGEEPQPGLALLRLAQGRAEIAVPAIRRALAVAREPVDRARLLPAFVEIMVAAGDLDAAEEGCRDLDRIAAAFGSRILDAVAAHARGAVHLARGEAATAIAPLREAFATWHRFGAPYIAARIRILVGLACRALGDEEGWALEIDAARAVFADLGARPDLARLEAGKGDSRNQSANGLSPREREVLALVAAGSTNKAIAAKLALSEKTVDRHVSNILVKLNVPSRAAATAYAIRRGLI
jgi:DNA-binding CsgD family transcriptional regulator